MNLGYITSLKGLRAAQRLLDVAGHNVANAETEGYSRQRAELIGGTPIPMAPVGFLGTGVEVAAIRRVRDQWVDFQLRAESANLGEANVRQSMLSQMEEVLGEPSDHGLGAQLKMFWESWQNLSARPEDPGLRSSVRQSGLALAQKFNDLTAHFGEMRRETLGRIRSTVEEINGLAKRIAELNNQIGRASAATPNPNDLKDEQDRLLTRLASKADISVFESPVTGMQGVFIGGHPLVSADRAYDLSTKLKFDGDVLSVPFVESGIVAAVKGGELGALLAGYNQNLSETDSSGVPAQIHELARGVMMAVNAVHSAGYGLNGSTGVDFFVGTNAQDIAVNPAIGGTPAGLALVAAAGQNPLGGSSGPADNSSARALAALRRSLSFSSGTLTPEGFYQETLTQLGFETLAAKRRVQTQDVLVESIKERQAMVSQVSIDEEMANVVRFQKAYAASARIFSTVEDMLDVLVNLGR